MISKNQIKLIKQLEQKKFRRREGLFVAEGPKVVGDLMKRTLPVAIYATDDYTPPLPDISAQRITPDELHRISFLQHPQHVLALFPIPAAEDFLPSSNHLTIALDGIQDPGNLGTIIRMAEGAGLSGVIMSKDTVDIYNPKVVRSTMGSIFRVPFTYVESLGEEIIKLKEAGNSICAGHLDGVNLYSCDFRKGVVVLIGNEGNGLSKSISDIADSKIRIPMYGEVESLNAAMAATIISYEILRQRLD
jgi:TrmH family RNA methyltransferase